MTTREQRDLWRRLAEEATPGPWYPAPYDDSDPEWPLDPDLMFMVYRHKTHCASDAVAECFFGDMAFIAASREAVPALLEDAAAFESCNRARAAAERDCDRLREALETIAATGGDGRCRCGEVQSVAARALAPVEKA